MNRIYNKRLTGSMALMLMDTWCRIQIIKYGYHTGHYTKAEHDALVRDQRANRNYLIGTFF